MDKKTKELYAKVSSLALKIGYALEDESRASLKIKEAVPALFMVLDSIVESAMEDHPDEAYRQSLTAAVSSSCAELMSKCNKYH